MTRYTLPPADAEGLGGIKVGEDFEIATDGTLNIKGMEEMMQSVKELPEKVSEGKALIAEAITEKGVNTDSAESFQTLADNILQIEGKAGIGLRTNREQAAVMKSVYGFAAYEA